MCLIYEEPITHSISLQVTHPLGARLSVREPDVDVTSRLFANHSSKVALGAAAIR